MEMKRGNQEREEGDKLYDRDQHIPQSDNKQDVEQEFNLDYDEDLQIRREPTLGTLMMVNFLNKFKGR